MEVLVILAHPNKESFNQPIAEAAVRTLEADGHDVVFHDLYAERVQPRTAVPRDSEGRRP